MYDANEYTEEYPGTVQQETDKAKLVDFGGDKPVWVPRSVIKGEAPEGQATLFTLPVWFAVREGLE